MSSLKKPTTNLFRSFLYLNGDEVLNSLSALEGGDVDEVLVRMRDESGHELGGQLGSSAVGVKGGRKKGKSFEEELKRKRTQHSAAAVLLRKLEDEGALGRIEGDYGAEEHEALDERMLLEFRADIKLHPLHHAVTAARGFVEIAPTWGLSKQELEEARQTVRLLEAMSSSGGAERSFLVLASVGPSQGEYRLVLPLSERHLLVPLDDLVGRATFVAQVDRVLREGESVLAMRLIRNSPALPLEREALTEALPDLIAGFGELGITAELADFVLTAPAVLLRPIVIYK